MSNNWPIVPLGEVIEHRKEFIEIDDLTEYKRCRVQSYAKGVVLRDIVMGLDIKTKKQQICRPAEFLVAEIDAKVGGYGIVPPELDGAIVSSHYFLYVIDEKNLSPDFLNYFIRTPTFFDQVSAQGSTNYAAIRPHHVLEYEIPLPPLTEQRRVVARIEELAAKVERAQSLRRQAVEEIEALTVSQARHFLESISAEITQLGCWLAANREGIQTGPFGVQLGSDDFIEIGHPILTIGNIQYGGIKLDGPKYVSEEKAEQLNRYAVEEGDILFARMGTVGRCCVAQKKIEGWLINYHIIRVALDKSQVEPRYIHWCIRASKDIEEYLEDKTRGTTRKGVNSKIVRELPVRIPPLPEQQRIVAYLDSLQAKVEAVKRHQATTAAKLEALLPSILDRAFRGEL